MISSRYPPPPLQGREPTIDIRNRHVCMFGTSITRAQLLYRVRGEKEPYVHQQYKTSDQPNKSRSCRDREATTGQFKHSEGVKARRGRKVRPSGPISQCYSVSPKSTLLLFYNLNRTGYAYVNEAILLSFLRFQ